MLETLKNNLDIVIKSTEKKFENVCFDNFNIDYERGEISWDYFIDEPDDNLDYAGIEFNYQKAEDQFFEYIEDLISNMGIDVTVRQVVPTIDNHIEFHKIIFDVEKYILNKNTCSLRHVLDLPFGGIKMSKNI